MHDAKSMKQKQLDGPQLLLNILSYHIIYTFALPSVTGVNVICAKVLSTVHAFINSSRNSHDWFPENVPISRMRHS